MALTSRSFFSFLIIVSAVLVAVVAFFWVDAGSTLKKGAVVTLSGDANLRTCPYLRCRPIARLQHGTAAIFLDSRPGERSFGSNLWREVLAADGRGFVHSHFIVNQQLRRNRLLESVISVTTVLLMSGLWVIIQIRRKGWARRLASQSDLDEVLFASVVALGIASIVTAFVLAGLEELSFTTFLADALLSLGSGLIGAGVTFVLFQVLLSVRNVSRDDFERIDSKISAIAGDLRRQRSVRRDGHAARRRPVPPRPPQRGV